MLMVLVSQSNCWILSSNISKYKFSIEIYSSEIFHLIPIRGFSLNDRRFIEELNFPMTKSIRVEFSSYRPASAFVWFWKDFQNHKIDCKYLLLLSYGSEKPLCTIQHFTSVVLEGFSDSYQGFFTDSLLIP